MPEQLREIRRHAESHKIEIVAEFQEAASAYRHQARRHEFHRMIDRACGDPDVCGYRGLKWSWGVRLEARNLLKGFGCGGRI
jgi:hypothetical protein